VVTPEAAPTETPNQPTETAEAQPTPIPSATPEPEATPVATAAEDPAQIVNDEGGVVNISGAVTYTYPFFTLGVAAPLVILEDQAGFVDRNESFLMPVESQTLGQITSDFFTSPFSYNVSLPIEPQGSLRDVDQDGEAEMGVQIFAIAYWNNIFGDPFLEERDLSGGGWSTAYASTRISDEAATEREVIGGKLLVYAPDGQQGFPAGFGPDGLLFTEDDPTVTLPAGYTLVDMDTLPFTFDRSRHQVVDLIEPEAAALVDYSDLGYTEAFDRLVEQLAKEYAFTEYKDINWKALHDEFRPRFEQAEERSNPSLYREALRDFAWSIPDGHVQGPFLVDQFRLMAGGGVGMAVRELDDGQVLVNFLLEGGSSDLAGIELGAEIVAINGVPMANHIGGVVSQFGPYSTAHAQRLDQQIYSTRFPIGMDVEASFINPGESGVRIADLIVTSESESLNFWFEESDRDGFELPVEYEIIEGGLGYVQILSFSDNDLLTVQLWERMITAMNENRVPALIIDMRQNGGGRGFLADQMAAYFFDEPLVLGNTGSYDEDRGEFYFDPRGENRFYLPAEELRYHGELAVLVGPDCASACEFFSYDLTLQDRATVIGHYPTAGLGGSIDQVAMPEGENFTFTQGRAVDAEGKIHIEGIGVVPDIRVPVTAAVLGGGDAVLEAAILHLTGNVLDGGEISVGDEFSDSLTPDSRIRYQLSLSQGQVVSIILEADKTMFLGFYDENGDLLGSREGRRPALEAFEVPVDFVLIVEVAVADDSGIDAFLLRILADEG
jgi:C-terminal processing protease CtpA/Prc